jgi:glycerol-3-phosphate dehydrogenase (NAD(P)+)
MSFIGTLDRGGNGSAGDGSGGDGANDGSGSVRNYDRIAVLGGGAWGTALASIAARAGRDVTLWARRPEVVREIVTHHTSDAYLPGIPLPDSLHASTDFAATVRAAEVVLIVTPSRTIRAICRDMAPHIAPGVPVFLCAKGIEVGTGRLLSEIAAQELPGHAIGALSGPTFADETAKGYPTAVTIASEFSDDCHDRPENNPATRLAVSLGLESFRPYISDDVVGVEIGGAMKNVVAIACGMMTGAGFAENTRAALITRGLDEMKALADALGGQRETVTGLSGVGDLTLTCSSTSSRNMSLGVQLGSGRARGDCFDGRPVVVEGEINAISVTDLARRLGVHLPICEAVRAILHEGAGIGETFAALWSRPIQGEPRALSITFAHPADAAAVQRFAKAMS